jgi:hypothetical protein
MNDTDTNEGAVHRALIAIAEGNFGAALDQFEADAKWRRTELLPNGGTFEGREAIGKMLTDARERVGGRAHILNLTIHGSGEHVFADYTFSPSSDPQEEGAEHVLTAFEVVLGKIREVRQFAFKVR